MKREIIEISDGVVTYLEYQGEGTYTQSLATDMHTDAVQALYDAYSKRIALVSTARKNAPTIESKLKYIACERELYRQLGKIRPLIFALEDMLRDAIEETIEQKAGA